RYTGVCAAVAPRSDAVAGAPTPPVSATDRPGTRRRMSAAPAPGASSSSRRTTLAATRGSLAAACGCRADARTVTSSGAAACCGAAGSASASDDGAPKAKPTISERQIERDRGRARIRRHWGPGTMPKGTPSRAPSLEEVDVGPQTPSRLRSFARSSGSGREDPRDLGLLSAASHPDHSGQCFEAEFVPYTAAGQLRIRTGIPFEPAHRGWQRTRGRYARAVALSIARELLQHAAGERCQLGARG